MSKGEWTEYFVFVLSYLATVFGLTLTLLLATCLSPLALISAAVAGAGFLVMKATVW